MTAGRGITHSERFERARREGGMMNGLQAWVALPNEHEETEPAFAHHEGAELPIGEESGARLRLIAGEAYGLKSGVHVYSPLFYVHAELDAAADLALPSEYSERALYVVSGSVEIEGQRVQMGDMAVLKPGGAPRVRASESSTVMLLGGESVGPRFIEWNFVSSSKERIEQAKADWRAGRMKLPDLDNGEFIPLPEEPAPAPNPMS